MFIRPDPVHQLSKSNLAPAQQLDRNNVSSQNKNSSSNRRFLQDVTNRSIGLQSVQGKAGNGQIQLKRQPQNQQNNPQNQQNNNSFLQQQQQQQQQQQAPQPVPQIPAYQHQHLHQQEERWQQQAPQPISVPLTFSDIPAVAKKKQKRTGKKRPIVHSYTPVFSPVREDHLGELPTPQREAELKRIVVPPRSIAVGSHVLNYEEVLVQTETAKPGERVVLAKAFQRRPFFSKYADRIGVLVRRSQAPGGGGWMVDFGELGIQFFSTGSINGVHHLAYVEREKHIPMDEDNLDDLIITHSHIPEREPQSMQQPKRDVVDSSLPPQPIQFNIRTEPWQRLAPTPQYSMLGGLQPSSGGLNRSFEYEIPASEALGRVEQQPRSNTAPPQQPQQHHMEHIVMPSRFQQSSSTHQQHQPQNAPQHQHHIVQQQPQHPQHHSIQQQQQQQQQQQLPSQSNKKAGRVLRRLLGDAQLLWM